MPKKAERNLFMIENTISIDESTVVEDMADNATDNAECTQGEDWRADEEKESRAADVQQTSDEGETNPSEDKKISLTVYGQQVEVSLEEAKAAAQKGMAFEQMKGQLAVAKNSYYLKAMEDMAKESGIDLAEYITRSATEASRKRLEESYGSLSAVPFHILEKEIVRISQLKSSMAEQATEERKDVWRDQLADFLRDNPGCKVIPDQVIETAKLTGNLALAYSMHNADSLKARLEQTTRELDMLKADAQSKKKALPTARSTAAEGSYRDDDFYKMMKSTW